MTGASAEVTLVCVDTLSPNRGASALMRSLDCFRPRKSLFLSNERPSILDARSEFIHIDALRSVEKYSDLILYRLIDYIETSHVLVVQWDGFVLDGSVWSDEFLKYDYIGAVWPQYPPENSVGNGGFSLRSRKLLAAIKDPGFISGGPEDVDICITNRQLLIEKYDLKFAPIEVAERFSCERGVASGKTFGFHGLFNFAKLFPDDVCATVEGLEDALLRNRDSRDLCIELLKSDREDHRNSGWSLGKRILLNQRWHARNRALIHEMLRSMCRFMIRDRSQARS